VILLCFLFQKCIYVLLELLENDKSESFIFLIEYDYVLSTFLIWSILLETLLDGNENIMLNEI